MLQDRAIRGERRRHVAAGETAARDAAGGVDVRRRQRHDLLRGRERVFVVAARREEIHRQELRGEKVRIGRHGGTQCSLGLRVLVVGVCGERVGERVERGGGGRADLDVCLRRDPLRQGDDAARVVRQRGGGTDFRSGGGNELRR